jgi:hypothetical protein
MSDETLPPCPTPCDDDCELNPDGCHESHIPDHGNKRGHQPHGCLEIRRAIAAAVAAEQERAEAEHAEYLSRLTQEMDATLRDERDRIIALAERCYATCQDQNGDSYPFADAIREQQ